MMYAALIVVYATIFILMQAAFATMRRLVTAFCSLEPSQVTARNARGLCCQAQEHKSATTSLFSPTPINYRPRLHLPSDFDLLASTALPFQTRPSALAVGNWLVH
eukprot:2088010-Pleurochrysis_carterae.AAC.5